MRVLFCGLRSLGLAGGDPDALLHVILQVRIPHASGMTSFFSSDFFL
jgi:hypothetical protein